MSIPDPRSILGTGERYASDVKNIFGNLSQTNHYLVDFSSLTTADGKKDLLEHIKTFGVDINFISRNSGILCSEASLPGTSLATAEVKDNFMGIPQEYAHTRLYTDIDFTFYVDHDYNNLKFFEGWVDFIGSGSNINELQGNYYRRMRYPDSYKCQTMSITKFEKDFKSRMSYLFINAFPKLITAIPVSYGPADILRVNVSFNYDRYIFNRVGSFIPGKPASESILESTPSKPPTPPVRQNYGNTYGPGSDFVERDPATGVRMDGKDEPEPITYRQELGLDPI